MAGNPARLVASRCGSTVRARLASGDGLLIIVLPVQASRLPSPGLSRSCLVPRLCRGALLPRVQGSRQPCYELRFDPGQLSAWVVGLSGLRIAETGAGPRIPPFCRSDSLPSAGATVD